MVDGTRYRKRPVEVDAVRWTGDNEDAMHDFAGGDWEPLDLEDRTEDPDATACIRDSLHSSWILMQTGDWVVKGIRGEFYPVRDDVFRETYERSTGANTALRTKPKLAVDPGTGVHWLSLRTGPRGYVARSIQMSGPGADENRCVVEDEANKINGIWILDYDGDGNLCGVEVV